ncbi:adenylate/guanylate cyclase domain-containing protein [Hoeflea poritis]|uniref:HAMP domain-containing protein n=1 Tax=Hoeflea poritis TaxID=2993659 RepID=A0ABT4VR57_9HYPH|nr:adenylate/guanylate cyclase domain-containing protein [Hoeflea poritis]MDA4846660.1 HAMP domain-containing protein [Hoeflea poritis]
MKIPHKIFGIAALVFVIMGASITYSTYKLYLVSKEVSDLAEIFIPISDRIAEIDLEIAQQEIHVERLEKHLTGIKLIDEELQELASGIVPRHLLSGFETIEEKSARLEDQRTELQNLVSLEERDFEVREARVDEAVERAEALIARAITTAQTEEGRDALKSLLPQLQSIDQQHSNLHSQLTLLIEAFRQDSPMRFELEKLIEEEEDQLALNLRTTWESIAGFTESAALKAEEHERQALWINIILAALSGVLALVLCSIVIKNMLKPLRQLVAGTQEVEAGNLTGQLETSSSDEIGDLARSFNGMVEGLRKTEEIKDTFGQYVDPRVVSGLIGDTNMELVNGEKKVVSVLFADIANFTSISERFTPGGLVTLINRYLSMMSEPITEQQGLIDKYIGDAIMAFWTAPFCEDGEQARLAVGAALKDSALIEKLREELPELTGLRRDLPDVAMRIGIATGEAVVGSIGSEKTKNYTVMGDTVNLGARLEAANKVYGTSVLVCGRTCAMASGEFEFRRIDNLIVKGKTEPVAIYEPLGQLTALGEPVIELKERFEAALDAFSSGDWAKAETGFDGCRQFNDPVSEVYLERLAIIRRDGAPKDWNGVWQLDEK